MQIWKEIEHFSGTTVSCTRRITYSMTQEQELNDKSKPGHMIIAKTLVLIELHGLLYLEKEFLNLCML